MKSEVTRDHRRSLIALMSACATLAACGGGGGSSTAPPPPPPSSGGPTPPPISGLSDTVRTRAATTTAQSSSNACAPIQPFYWEIGDRAAKIASGAVNAAGNTTTYDASTTMAIASASKWLYGAYAVEKRNGSLTASDIGFLNFRSGYTNFSLCLPGQTVASCLAMGTNGDQTAANVDKFFYNGGHMQKHATLMSLGALDNVGLATEIQSQIGTEIAMSYVEPQLAGGVQTNADNYAKFLRKLLAGNLRMGNALGTNPVCTNPSTCTTAVSTPVPTTESWHYSIGHWVEDDPLVGDGAFSSAGAFGFYPWVDAGKTYYGILARHVTTGAAGVDSAMCGRLIRKAWVTGTAQ